MKKLPLFITFFFICLIYSSHAQTILYQENFEGGGASFSLNSAGVSTNTGTNKWIINNNYTAGAGYHNTINENHTYGGTISYGPNGHYLHIYDSSSTYTNCLYAPSNQSDRFACTTSGTCTFGYNNVSIGFFYLCEGSPTAYGTIYYSAENGPWTQCGIVNTPYYSSSYYWQYTSITNPAFNNISNLKFGFRWQNNAAAFSGPDTASAFGIDDIVITGTQNTSAIQINTIVTPTVICADGSATINLSFTQTDSLCDGSYNIDLVDSVNNVVAGWSITSSNPIINGPYALTIPNYVTGTHCYTWVVNRATTPAITGTASACFEVENCPNAITTLQPAATMDAINHYVCAGSTIQVPFNSTGTYGNSNIYIAQLSDAAGQFPVAKPDNVGTFIGSAAYPQANGSPGQVTSTIPDSMPVGCNYYVRVIANNPNTVGSVWGPFCITHCDMGGGAGTGGGGGFGGGAGGAVGVGSVLACIKSCYKDPKGFNDTLKFSTGSYNGGVSYGPGNTFQIQILSTKDLSVVSTGGLNFGATATAGKIVLHVPCADSICTYAPSLLYPTSLGGYGGSFYMRVIATNTTPPDSNVGPIMLFTIGYPNDSLVITPTSPSVYCINGASPLFTASPLDATCTENAFNTSSESFTWWTNGDSTNIRGYEFQPEYPAGTYTIMVKEDNNGCYGPLDTTMLYENGVPTATIFGPYNICLGDTVTFNTPFTNNTVYNWSGIGMHIIDSNTHVFKARFDSIGIFTINLMAYDSCGYANGTQKVNVIQCPTGIAAITNTKTSVTVHPNPSTGVFTLSIDNLQLGIRNTVEVYNTLGQEVYSKELSTLNSPLSIDLSNNPTGMYFYKIQSENGNLVSEGKLMIER